MPVIGNHEASDGDHVSQATVCETFICPRSSDADRCCQQYNRYLNQTWGEAGLLPAIASTADSALGHILSKGEHSNACHPSFTHPSLTPPLL